MALNAFKDCAYSAFFSYAEADDKSWNQWISDFHDELEEVLKPRVRGAVVPRMMFAGERPLMAGRLTEQLAKAIQSSFVLFVFVHDGYNDSEWCREELRYFREHFGSDGPRERLYVIAMSKTALEDLRRTNEWQAAVPSDIAVARFWRSNAPDRPIPVFASDTRRGRKTVIDGEFWALFEEIREDLVKKINESVKQEGRHASGYPTSAPRVIPARGAVPEDAVRVYIEGNESRRYFEGLSQQIVASWDRVVAQERVEPKLRLRPTGLEMDDIDKRPVLMDANGVILLWHQKTPESLVAQINAVEPRLSGPHAAPGLVAYLMADRDDRSVPRTVCGWPVVRFLTISTDGSATPLRDDEAELSDFLVQVLRHHRR